MDDVRTRSRCEWWKTKGGNLKIEAVNIITYNWIWDDDGQLGSLTIDCPCGTRVESNCYSLGEGEELTCECGLIYSVERTTRIMVEDGSIQNKS